MSASESRVRSILLAPDISDLVSSANMAWVYMAVGRIAAVISHAFSCIALEGTERQPAGVKDCAQEML